MIPLTLPAFSPVAAGSRAICAVPKYNMTLKRVVLTLGGTTLTKAYLTNIVLKLGTHPIWEVAGDDLDRMNKYKGLYDNSNHITLDFSDRDHKDIVAEEVGGIDFSKLTDGLNIEIDISASASAPTLTGKAYWTPPQGDDPKQLVKKIRKTTTPSLSSGRQQVTFDPKGALIQRIFSFYTGQDWNRTATAAAFTGNTGTGTIGTITVTAKTAKVGIWTLRIIEPGSNVGQFTLEDPDGVAVPVVGTVASAFTGGGLAFTLSDATDFVAGDGFQITVSESVNGNIVDMRVKKNGVPVWDEVTCQDVRFLQKEYRKVPQGQCYVTDFIIDNNQSAALVTDDAKSLEIEPNLTNSDTLTNYFEVLDAPYNL